MQLRDMVRTLESMGWPDESQVQQLIDTYLAQYDNKEKARRELINAVNARRGHPNLPTIRSLDKDA